MATDTREQAPRDKAVQQLKKRRDFRGHLLIYTLVNAFLVVIWAITDPHGFFWPVFPIAGWGIFVVMNAWDVYWVASGIRCKGTGAVPVHGDVRRWR